MHIFTVNFFNPLYFAFVSPTVMDTVTGMISFHFRSLSIQNGDSVSTMMVPLFLVSMVLIDVVDLTWFIELDCVVIDDDIIDVDLDTAETVEDDFDVDIDLVCPTNEDVPHPDVVIDELDVVVDEVEGLVLDVARDVMDLLCVGVAGEVVDGFDGESVLKVVLWADFDKKDPCDADPAELPPLLSTILFVSSMVSGTT